MIIDKIIVKYFVDYIFVVEKVLGVDFGVYIYLVLFFFN